jgi:hypothetical protein
MNSQSRGAQEELATAATTAAAVTTATRQARAAVLAAALVMAAVLPSSRAQGRAGVKRATCSWCADAQPRGSVGPGRRLQSASALGMGVCRRGRRSSATRLPQRAAHGRTARRRMSFLPLITGTTPTVCDRVPSPWQEEIVAGRRDLVPQVRPSLVRQACLAALRGWWLAEGVGGAGST